MWTTAERATAISLSPPSTPRPQLRPPPPPGPIGDRARRAGSAPLDGGWWPRSTDPVAELPGLIAALQAHDGPQAHDPSRTRRPITHFMLRTADWDSRSRRLRVDGQTGTQAVRLGWFDPRPAGLLTALYADGRRDLLTVPPATDTTAAGTTLGLAASPANRLRTPNC
ncbi:hypothetical protein GCM10023085_25050 [Actinomadura viridis]|uniref:Uncharacterized protein n=1 Tax=Actinomadura viridis TaxID=58110 RepID=A0A931DKT0_9ACTN|nr:DUF5994 family protein [Actinomadura viridis]MBG6088875.1 hypothetical protein [Actinomadura viridis]